MGTTVSVVLISPSTFTDMRAVSEKARKASQRAYQRLVEHKLTVEIFHTMLSRFPLLPPPSVLVFFV